MLVCVYVLNIYCYIYLHTVRTPHYTVPDVLYRHHVRYPHNGKLTDSNIQLYYYIFTDTGYHVQYVLYNINCSHILHCMVQIRESLEITVGTK